MSVGSFCLNLLPQNTLSIHSGHDAALCPYMRLVRILNSCSQLLRLQLSELLALYSQVLAHQILIIYALSSSEQSLKEHDLHLIKRQCLNIICLVKNSHTQKKGHDHHDIC